MRSNIFSWIRKQLFVLQLFVALMVNLMAFGQPLQYALNSRAMEFIPNYSGSYNSNTVNEDSNPSVGKTANQTTTVVKLAKPSTVINEVDADIIPAIEKQGIIGKSENLPIDELTDNIFSFDLKSEVKTNKDIYLEYELFGLADGSQAIKSVNDQLATGGSIIKTNKEWSKVKEKLNPSDIQKGKNNILFTTWENSKYQYMVKNLKLVYEDKTAETPIVFQQNEAKSFSGSVAVSGFVIDKNITKISILGVDYPVVNGVFEALVTEKEPNASLTVSYLDANGKTVSNDIKVAQLLDKPTELHNELKATAVAYKNFTKGNRNSLAFAGAKLEVDSLSLAENQNISIAGLRFVDVPTLSPEMVNVTAEYFGYRMLPHGNLFGKIPAKVSLKYDEKKLPSGYTAKDIKTFYFDTDQKKWLSLEKDTTLNDTKEIVSRTLHFTDFINGIIKVPESPETGSFTPTSIKDIKAAEPTAGVVSIAPPSPNNIGTANTSFPIKLPAGRSGMQPSLSVNYSSEGGNGWMGLGWDLSIPGVSLDTRWGAPRYDGTNETEIYSMGGGMLTLDAANQNGGSATPDYTNPNRKDDILRNTNNQRRFFPRIEGSYAEIIRHGGSPSTYWWEVTDKMGNKSFYGGYTRVGVVDNAVIKTYDDGILTDSNGNVIENNNISYWGLYRTEDTNHNYVEYIYEKTQASLGGAPGDGGNEFYIKEIKYTMHTGTVQPNYYKVEFERTVGRTDVQLNARNGVVQVTKDLLSEVKIGYQEGTTLKPIRSYRFNYDVHAFNKTQLTKIAEHDASGNLFYANTMEYEDKGDDGQIVSDGNIFKLPTDPSTDNWNNSLDDSVNGGLIIGNLTRDLTNNASILGSSDNGGFTGGLYLGFGVSCSGDNSLTGGVNFDYSYSSGGGLVSFTDINGDGLPDKVFRQSGGLFYKPNLGNGFDTVKRPIFDGFGPGASRIENFSRNSANSFSIGGSISFGAFIGYTYNKSKSTTSTYFSDVNGDGLTDLVENGTVKFNQARPSDYLNQVVFSDANALTSNPVGSGEVATEITNSVELETMEQLRDENPQHDVVKIWIAPKPGTIKIDGIATLIPDPSTLQVPYPALPTSQYFNDYDGVKLSIQRNTGPIGPISPTNLPTILFITPQTGVDLIPPFNNVAGAVSVNNPSHNFTADNLNVTVNKGDRLFFRVQARDEGTFDRVRWNPEINYISAPELDANKLDYFSSKASEGFILSADNRITLAKQDGTAILSLGTLNIPALPSLSAISDNLTFEIETGIVLGGTYTYANTYTRIYNQNTGFLTPDFGPIPLSYFISATGGPIPYFIFRVKSESNVDWKVIDWRPLITFTSTPPPGSPASVQNLNPIVNYQIYNKKINSDLISRFTINNITTPVVIKPVIDLNYFDTLPNGEYHYNLIVKNNNKKVIGRKSGINEIKITVDNTNFPISVISGGDNIDIRNDLTSNLFVEFYTTDLTTANLNYTTDPVKAEIYQAINITPVQVLPLARSNTTTIRKIDSVNFHTLNDIGLTNSPYYEDRNTTLTTLNIPNLIKGDPDPYYLEINLSTFSGTKNAAAWIDFDGMGDVDTNEFFTPLPQDPSFPNQRIIEITIPSSLPSSTNGLYKIRIKGGSSTAYSILNFITDTPPPPATAGNFNGTVRDYTINIVSFLNQTSKSIYAAIGNDKFGPNHRDWGQFGYHGGITVTRDQRDYNRNGTIDANEYHEVLLPVNVTANYGIDSSGNVIPIDETVLVDNPITNPAAGCTGTDAQIRLCMEQNSQTNPQLATNVRFFSLNPRGGQVGQKSIWQGSSEFVNVEEEFFSTSRMGVRNLNTIFTTFPVVGANITASCTFPQIRGVKLINKGEGHSFAGGFSVPGTGGASGSYSSSFNWAELNYMDMNGDRYPDLLTRDNIQFTGNVGGLKGPGLPINFHRVSSGHSESWGASAEGTFVTSKTCDPQYDVAFAIGSNAKPTIPSLPEEQAKSSIGVSVNFGGGTNTEENLWIDMNGDGLVDRVNVDNDIHVRLNLGYGLESQPTTWYGGIGSLGGEQHSVGGGAGFSYGFNAFSVGVSASASRSFTNRNLMDINGDGLPDLLFDTGGGNFEYKLNTGNGFSGGNPHSSGGGYISFNREIGESANGSFTIPICIMGLFQININPKISFNQSFTREDNTLADINGDGYPDILNNGDADSDDSELYARLSNIGKTNLLKTVHTPTGGSWEVAYDRVGNTFDMPSSKYVMSKVAIFDGFTGDNQWSPDRTVTSVQYQNPYHDRREREFFGFETVRVNQHGGYNDAPVLPITLTTMALPSVYRYSVQKYHNRNYYLKGAVKTESLYADFDGLPANATTPQGLIDTAINNKDVLWTKSVTTYGVFKPRTILTKEITRPAGFTDTNYNLLSVDPETIRYGQLPTALTPTDLEVIHNSTNLNFICTDLDRASLFVTPIISVKTFTEGATSNWKHAVTIMEEIDAVGNITQYRDYGEQGTDTYVSKITYNTAPMIAGSPSSLGYPLFIRVFDAAGTTLQRERQAMYDGNGSLTSVFTTLTNTGNTARINMTYDIYGNLDRVTNTNSINPANNQPYFKQYTYDPLLHTFSTRVEDAFGYFSTSSYNYLFGIPVYTTDMNGQPMRTRIDDRGRPIEITGPYELYLEGITGGTDNAWTIRFEYENQANVINGGCETPVATRVAGFQPDQYGDIADLYNGVVNAVGNMQPSNPPLPIVGYQHHALTRHFDSEYRSGGNESVLTTNQILTATLVDGFGKPIQVKKSAAIFDGLATVPSNPQTVDAIIDNNIKWILNGKARTDAFGRAIESYYPTEQIDDFTGLNNTTSGLSFIPSNAFLYANNADAQPPTVATYDVLDRSLTTQLPGESNHTTMEYGINTNRFETIVTNEKGQIQKSYTDVRGRTLQTVQEAISPITTNFVYNNIGELMIVTDVTGDPLDSLNTTGKTYSFYDLAGRRTELRHPDNGITKFTYDNASNLTRRETSNLLATTVTPPAVTPAIEYHYTFNRLDEIKYPTNPENDVHYYYGTALNADAANDNAVGRLWYHIDASGTQYFKYGKLGELTKNRRSIAVPGDKVYWFQTDWTYDTWNRVKTITYPDEEVVTYQYNKGGELHAMTSNKGGVNGLNIISQLGYDKFGQRTYLRYGNGTETTYNYEADRRRLDRMKVSSNANYGATTNRTFIHNQYAYDELSNVISIANNGATVAMPSPTQIGGKSYQSFEYDDLNRLTSASGQTSGNNETGTGVIHNKYTLGMTYDNQHNIVTKNQTHLTATGVSPPAASYTNAQTEQTNYHLDYGGYDTAGTAGAGYTVAGYTYKQPHAPRTIIDQPVAPGATTAANDPRIKTKNYEYDCNGNQTLITQTVCNAPGETPTPEILRENLWDEENRLRAIDLNPEASAVHPIAIYTYDAGGERIIKNNATNIAVYENAKKAGETTRSDFMLYPSGMLVFRPGAGGVGGGSYTKHYFAGSQRVSSKIGTTTNLGSFLQDWTQQENSSGGASINLVGSSHAQLIHAETAANKVYIAFNMPTQTFTSNSAFIPVPFFTPPLGAGGLETEQYYFHPDHLGSSNYITNIAGEVSQHTEYFAFGETFVEEHKGSNNSPYKFNGKELDAESGLYYYGARYYDPRVSIWMSTDPLTEKYPGMSAYNYCANNPLRYIDPDGRFLFDVHHRILENAIAGLKFNFCITFSMGLNRYVYQGGIVSPDMGEYHAGDHFDSMNSKEIGQNFQKLDSNTSDLISNYNSGKLSAHNFGTKIGETLHSIQDFYSHSNFVELFEESGGNINGKIPTYEEVMGGKKYEKFKAMINAGKLVTGEYDENNHKVGSGSHKQMNKDQGAGSDLNNIPIVSNKIIPDAAGNKPTKYSKAAERAATRASKNYLINLSKKIK